MLTEQENLRRYFLGDLAESDADAIEIRLMEEPDFEADLVTAEHELIEDFLDGELSAEDQRLFEDNYLATPERRKNIQAYEALRVLSKKKLQVKATTMREPQPYLLDRLRGIVPMPVVVAAAIVLLVVGGYFLVFRDSRTSALQTEYAALNSSDLSDLEAFRALPGLTVFPGATRGGKTGSFERRESRQFFVRVVLPPEMRDMRILGARIGTEGSKLLSFDKLKVYGTDQGKELRLLLPAELLSKGSYKIEVFDSVRTDAPITYNFTVE